MKTETSESSETRLSKVSTHIAGLDIILQGGLPEGQSTLVVGGPGSGKSVLGMQFLYHEALAGNAGIFITFEEQAENVRFNAKLMGWDAASQEKSGKLFILEVQLDPSTFVQGDFDIDGLLSMLLVKSRQMGAKRVVLDAIDVLLQYYNDPCCERQAMYALHRWLLENKLTVIITSKSSTIANVMSEYKFLEYLTNCVIQLSEQVSNRVATRLLRVIKYRGSDFSHNEFPYLITKGGLQINSVPSVSLANPPISQFISSGHPMLDSLLGGGFPQTACILIAGSTGTGKTTIACQFARTACSRGEKTLYISFEESEASLVSTMLSPGIDLRPALADGTLHFFSSMPEAMNVEKHLFMTFQKLRHIKPAHIIIDAISACKRMGSPQHAHRYLTILMNECKKGRITCVFVNQTSSFAEIHDITGIGISSMVDSVLFLRFVEEGGELNRMLTVIKSRGIKHSNQFREYEITANGLEIKEVYLGEGGLLTGVTRKEQEARERREHQRRLQSIRAQKNILNQKRAALEADTANSLAEIEASKSTLEILENEETIWRESIMERAAMRGADLENPQISKQFAGESHE